jgi:hypothetical protein
VDIYDYIETLARIEKYDPEHVIVLPFAPIEFPPQAYFEARVPVAKLRQTLEHWQDRMPEAALVDLSRAKYYEKTPEAQDILALFLGSMEGKWLAWMVNEWHEGYPQEILTKALLKAAFLVRLGSME